MSGLPSAMVLAAGYATRLRPLTDDIAKAVVPFLNRPLLDYTLQWLADEGFDRVVINLHHAADSIRDHYGASAFGMRIFYSPEAELLGTAGGPRQALPLLGSRILLINGDVLARVALQPLLRHHVESGALATLGLYGGEGAGGYPQVIADRRGRLLGFPGDRLAGDVDDVVRGVFTGIHIVERSVIEALPSATPLGMVSPVYRGLLAAGSNLAALPVQGFWYEVGDPSRYLHAQLGVLRSHLLPQAVAGYRQCGGDGYVDPAADASAATLAAPYMLGPGARVAGEARVRAVVLGTGAIIEAHSEVEESVLWDGARVGAGCRLREVVVMRGVTVPPGTAAARAVFSAAGTTAFPATAQRSA